MENETREFADSLPQAERLDKKSWHAPEFHKSEIRDRTGFGGGTMPDGIAAAINIPTVS
jgi:hypothetical protein